VIDIKKIPEYFIKEGWSSGKMRGETVLSLGFQSPEDLGPDKIELLSHEGFHIVAQPSWYADIQGESGRGDLYPEDWEPRYFRREIMKSLYHSFTDDEKKALKDAISWYQDYMEKFPEDAERYRQTDIIEGTAEFAGLMGGTFGRLGKAVSKSELYNEIAFRIKVLWQRKYNNYSYMDAITEGESYFIGCLACLVLEKEGINGWKEQVEKGETPMNVLCRNFKPGKISRDPVLENKIKEYYGQKNKEMKETIDRFLNSTEESGATALAIPAEMSSGFFNRKGLFYFISLEKKRQLIIGMTASFVVPETISKIDVSNVTAEIVAGETPYGTIGYFLVPVDKKSVMRSKDGECRIDQNSISAFLTSFYEEKTKAGSIRLWPRKVILPEEGREKE